MKNTIGRALHLFNSKTLENRAIWAYCLPLFFWVIADSVMSYIFPIIVEEHVNSNALLGIIMACSSIAGLIADFIFPQLLRNRTWKFQLLLSILLAFLFPLSLTLGASMLLVYLFILGSIIWGIYWELMSFSQQNYVLSEDKGGQYSKDWGIIFMIFQIGTVIGPMIGSLLIVQSLMVINVSLFIIQFICLVFTLIIIWVIPNKKPVSNTRNIRETFSLIRELKYWKVLTRSVWPVMVIAVTLGSINAVFWTIGGLFGQRLFGDGLDWIVIVLFTVPSIMGSLLLTKIAVKKGKKRYAIKFLILGSAFLSLLILTQGSNLMTLFLIVMTSFCFSFVGPLNEAIFSDLLDRLKKERSHLLGIDKANGSIAFIIGPLLAGFLADSVDYFMTFAIAGAIGVSIGVILLVLTPKKLKLSQKEISTIH